VSSALVECVWQSSSPHASITVQVAFLPNVSEAQAAYAEAVASQNFAVKDVPNFADKAAIVRAPGIANTGGIYVREGSLFFDVVYVRGAAPTDGQLKLAAEIVLGGLPTL
jgi:hypothetical protein